MFQIALLLQPVENRSHCGLFEPAVKALPYGFRRYGSVLPDNSENFTFQVA
jgi:hypothetical protein